MRSVDTPSSERPLFGPAVSDEAQPKPERTARAPRTRARAWVHRLVAAVGIPALALGGLEAALRLCGFGQEVGFLVPDERPGWYRSNPEFVSLFLPSGFDLRPLNLSLPLRKAPHAVRIVVLGESAAQGIPAPAFGFAPQLRAQLRARYPGKDIEVVNTGLVAINSHVVYQVARQLARFSPDLFVVYMGNNEVVGPYGPGCAYLSQMPPLWVIRLSVFVKSTRTGQLAARVIARLGSGGRGHGEWGGMPMFVDSAVCGDDPRLGAVYRNFEANLRDIVGVASGAGAKTLLCTVASNLKDCAPLLSRHRAGLSATELARWEKAFKRGRTEWLFGEYDQARAELLGALEIDPQYADTSFMLGSIELAQGDIESARARFVDAEHWDGLRFRPDPRINEIIRRVAREGSPGVGLVDVADAFGSEPSSRMAPAGRQLFFEHVHLNWNGNYALARRLAQESARVLYGDAEGSAAWLDARACAQAVGFTAHERYAVLEKVLAIVQFPPFAGQLTYCEDQARLAAELAAAKAERDDPKELTHAMQGVRAALGSDPANADLVKIEEELEDQAGDLEAALAASRRAQQLQPSNPALAGDEAIKLSRLGRYEEAEQLLRRTLSGCSPRDRSLIAPAFGVLFTRSGRFEEGRRFLDAEIARQSGDPSLRFLRGRLAEFSGDTAAAEREFRAILASNPGNVAVLEELVALLEKEGQGAKAREESLAAAGQQTRNQSNNLRAAAACDLKRDDAGVVQYLLAAERSGPLNSGVELNLARRLMRMNRGDDALEHLGEALRLSVIEGNPAVTDAIRRAIETIRAHLR